MKLFRHIRKCFKIQGVYAVQSNRKCLLNPRNLFILFFLLQMFLSSLAYFLYEAKSIGEYADTFFMIFTTVVCVIFFSIGILKMSRIHKLIGEFEEFINKSEFETCSKYYFVFMSKRNQFNEFRFRIGGPSFTGYVCPIDRQNRTNVGATLFCYGQVDRARTCDSSAHYHTRQLFHLQFRWRFILLAISCDVRSNWYQKFGNLISLIISVSTEGYHSIGRHHLVICWPWSYKPLRHCVRTFPAYQWHAFCSKHANCLKPSLKTFQMKCPNWA